MRIILSLMDAYEALSVIGGVLQMVLFILKRKNNILLTLGMIMDAIGLTGVSFGHIIRREYGLAICDFVAIVLDVIFVLYIIYRDEHPKKG
ncbi:hypothetical protein IKE99_00415 [Candidatus Saccharibacteria bacterium]|nr:hypothetical protein [Candidatus Saccharibacteria bacterium]